KIEMQLMRRTRSFEKYENADNQINQTDDFEIFLMPEKLLGRLENNRGGPFLFVADYRVGCALPDAYIVENLCDVKVVLDLDTIDRLQGIALFDSGFIRRTIADYDLSLDTCRTLNP